MAQSTLNDFLNGRQKLLAPLARRPHTSSKPKAPLPPGIRRGLAGLDRLAPTSTTDEAPLVERPSACRSASSIACWADSSASQQNVRAYAIVDPQRHVHHAASSSGRRTRSAATTTWQGTDWKKPPLIAHPDEERKIGPHTYMFFSDAATSRHDRLA